jgi:hypothetical protein
VDLLDPNDTFADAGLGNGDIICIQKLPSPDKSHHRPQASGFYSDMLSSKVEVLQNNVEDATSKGQDDGRKCVE